MPLFRGTFFLKSAELLVSVFAICASFGGMIWGNLNVIEMAKYISFFITTRIEIAQGFFSENRFGFSFLGENTSKHCQFLIESDKSSYCGNVNNFMVQKAKLTQ